LTDGNSADETAFTDWSVEFGVTEVCLVGTMEDSLRYELLSRETAREALATYDLREPYPNTLALHTVSLGAAVALLNDLNWYLVRFAAAALVREPEISTTEWLSRDLAEAVRDERIDPEETGRYRRQYNVIDGELAEPIPLSGDERASADERGEIEDTLVVRVTEAEFDG